MYSFSPLRPALSRFTRRLTLELFKNEDDATDSYFMPNSIRFETFESRVLLSAAIEIVSAPLDTNQPVAATHYDIVDKPLINLDQPSRAAEPLPTSATNAGVTKQQPDPSDIGGLSLPGNSRPPINSISDANPTQGKLFSTSTNQPILAPVAKSEAQPDARAYKGYAAARALNAADANLFNNASTVPSPPPSSDSAPSPVSPDPVPNGRQDPSVWSDWMPGYQAKLKTTEQTQITMGTSMSGHGNSSTANQGSASSLNQGIATDNPVLHEKPRADLARDTDPQNSASAIHKLPSHLTEKPGIEKNKSEQWHRSFVVANQPNIAPTPQIRIEIHTEPRTTSFATYTPRPKES